MDDRLRRLEQRLRQGPFAERDCLCGQMSWVTSVTLAWALREAGLDPAVVATRLATHPRFTTELPPGEFMLVEGSAGLWKRSGETEPHSECLGDFVQMVLGVATELLAE